jgi:hypothetical protein
MGRNGKQHSSVELLRMRRRVRELVCSEQWLEACWASLVAAGVSATLKPSGYLDRTGVYPPGGRRGTRMVHCHACGKRWYPPHYVQVDLCLDCAAGQNVPITDEQTHVSSTSSPTAIALRQMEMYHVRLIEPRLAAEDEATLRRQIAEHQAAKSKKPVCRADNREM